VETRKPDALAGYQANLLRFFLFTWLRSFHLWMPIWLVFLQDRGLTLAQVGVLDAAGWVLQSTAELPTGALADGYGRRLSMALGALLLGVGLLAVQAEPFSVPFLVGYMLWGVSHTFIGGADSAFLYDSLKAAGREDEYPRRAGQYTAVIWGAQATAAVAGGLLAAMEPSLCFTVSAALALGAAGVALTFREPPGGGPPSGRRGRAFVGTLRGGMVFAARTPQVRYPLFLGALIGTFSFFLAFMVLQPYARAAGIPYPAFGVLVLAARAFGVAGALSVGWARTRVSGLTAGVAASGIMAGCLGVMALGPAVWGLFPLPVATGTAGLVRPLLSHEVNRWTPAFQRATVLSAEGFLFTAILVVLDPLAFAAADRFGLPAALGLMAGAFSLLATPLLVGWYRGLRPGKVPRAGRSRRLRGSRGGPPLPGAEAFAVWS